MNTQEFKAVNFKDREGRPLGGVVHGAGLDINWHPLDQVGIDGRVYPNSVFVETVIEAALQRIEYYNEGAFRCRENSLAITKLEEALHWLNARTNRRVVQGVEGTHEGS